MWIYVAVAAHPVPVSAVWPENILVTPNHNPKIGMVSLGPCEGGGGRRVTETREETVQGSSPRRAQGVARRFPDLVPLGDQRFQKQTELAPVHTDFDSWWP